MCFVQTTVAYLKSIDISVFVMGTRCFLWGKKLKRSNYRPGLSPEDSRRLRLPDIKTIST